MKTRFAVLAAQERVGLVDGIHAYGMIDGAWRAAGEPLDMPVTGGRLEFVPNGLARQREVEAKRDATAEVIRAIKAFERQRRRSLTDDERETAAELLDYQSLMGRPVTIAEALNKATEICARERKAGKTYKRHRPTKKRGKR